MYSYNTLGALETQVREGSGGQFDAIRTTIIDGAPQYEFINSTIYSTVLPQQILYRPVVLSETRYNQIQPALGRLTVMVRCKDYDKTLDINPYDMNEVEQQVYEAKVPLNDNGFEYPIRAVYIDVVNFDIFAGLSYFAQDLLVNESDYNIDCGNLYFTKSLEEIISEKDSGFEEFLSQTWASKIIKSTMYYNVRIVFDRFVPDTTDETNSLALAQATSYAIMDYFNQYIYAEVSANMISEIAYTETLTFWSTLISAPLVYFGSWAVSSGVGKMFGKAGSELVQSMLQKSIMGGLVGMVVSPIKEVFQEIIEDGFKEALIENLVSIAGGTDDLGFWLSSLSTSVREVKGALGELTLGETNIKNTFSLIYAISSGDVDTRLELEQKISQDLKQRQEAEKAKQEQMSFLDKMLKTDLLKGLFMVSASLFFAPFGFIALSGLNKMITSSIKLSPAAYAAHKSWQHSRRKRATIKAVGTQSPFSSGTDRVLGQTKKPAELDSAKTDINEKYKDQQNSEKENPSLVAFLSSLNPNPKVETRKNLADKFNTIAFEGYFNEWIEGYVLNDERFINFKSEFKQIQRNYREIGFQKAEKDAINIIKEALEIDKFNLRFLNMFGVEFYDPDFVMIGAPGTSARSEGSRLWKQNAFEAKMTTLDKVNEIKSYFDVSSDYAMYVKAKDGQLIYIPVDSETNLADWLEDNHHNIDSKIYVAPKLLKIEQFHTLENWQDHPTYKLYQDMKALLTNRDPDEVTDVELLGLLGQVRNMLFFAKENKLLKNGLNKFFTDRTLYKWLYNIEKNQEFPENLKNSFKNLVVNYRRDNGLAHQDPEVDTLIKELMLAIQYEPDFLTIRGPSIRKLNEFFNLPSRSEVFTGDFRYDIIFKLLQGLYRRSSARFILDNLGKSRISDDKGEPPAVRKALLAVNKFSVSKNMFTENNELQKLIILLSWHLSNIHGGGKLLTMTELANHLNINLDITRDYLHGRSSNTNNIDIVNKLENLITGLKRSITIEQFKQLKEVYDIFCFENAYHYPGIHGVGHDARGYSKGFYNPKVVAKHIVELCIRQGGLMPAGRWGEGADNYNVDTKTSRHHINFVKTMSDVINLILMGNLHSTFTRLEAKGDLDYYTRMRYMRDGFEAARPPSFWSKKLQDKYIERLKEFVTEWESTKSSIRYTDSITGKEVDFIKIDYQGKTYNLQDMIEMGWITEDWVDNIIQDIKQKLKDQGLM